MRKPRAKRSHRGPPRAGNADSFRWQYHQRIEALEQENSALRNALREIVGWYDTFDSPAGADPDLTEADFARYRRLARYSLRLADRGLLERGTGS